jgi:hypothetical protein
LVLPRSRGSDARAFLAPLSHCASNATFGFLGTECPFMIRSIDDKIYFRGVRVRFCRIRFRPKPCSIAGVFAAAALKFDTRFGG